MIDLEVMPIIKVQHLEILDASPADAEMFENVLSIRLRTLRYESNNIPI
jgi:hypothetical protein